MLTPDARDLLQIISTLIDPEPSKITVGGHTNALRCRDSKRVNNWSLLVGRAEASRQMLMQQGIATDRYHRIEGVADTEPLISADPSDPRNRPIPLTFGK